MRRTVAMIVFLTGVPSGCSSHHQRLQENIDTLLISITLNPMKPDQRDPGGGLRSLLLHQGGLLIEPHAGAIEGDPVSADAQVSKQTLLGIVEDLERLGLWKDAKLYYSEARQNPRSAPPAGSDFASSHKVVLPSCEIKATYASGDYRSYVVVVVPWGNRTINVLKALKGNIPAPLGDKLVETCRRFP